MCGLAALSLRSTASCTRRKARRATRVSLVVLAIPFPAAYMSAQADTITAVTILVLTRSTVDLVLRCERVSDVVYDPLCESLVGLPTLPDGRTLPSVFQSTPPHCPP